MSEDIQSDAEGITVPDANEQEQAVWDEFDQEESAPSDERDDISEDSFETAEAEPEEAEQSEDESEASDSSDEQEPNDIWATATTEQREAFERAQSDWQTRDKRLRGQVSALQRQINELQTKSMQESSAKAEPNADHGDTGILGSDEWKDFQDEYPEVAGPIAQTVNSLQSHITRLEKEMSAIGQERRQNALNEQADLLASEHPDWESAIGEPSFGEWLSSQPRHIQEAAYRNGQEIVDAAEAADVVSRFKATLAPSQQPSGGNAQTPKQTLAPKRKRQLESATGAKSRGPGAAYGIQENGDEEAIWKQFDEMERRRGTSY